MKRMRILLDFSSREKYNSFFFFSFFSKIEAHSENILEETAT